ncbi:MAG TPA: hypothetical protein VMW80_06260 [Candidatus Dormibacteraeota bacterium]|nr:hypothetical protein [Candidatus Dormibacteraeota bacterium]
MLGAIRRGCTFNCLGCLIPVVVVVGLLLFAVHQWTTPPDYPPVSPAPPSALQLSAAEAVASALSSGQPVALVHLTDAEATGLLADTLTTYDGLSQLEVHVLQGQVVVSGRTTILNRPLVISGPVDFGGLGTSTIRLEFAGLSIGQMGLPSLIPQALARGFHPSLSLGLIDVGRSLTFSCEAARPNDLIVGVSFGAGAVSKGVNACAASS